MRVFREQFRKTRWCASVALLLLGACGDPTTASESSLSAFRARVTVQGSITTLFGPQRFVRAKGAPVTETVTIPTTGWSAPITLHVRSGDANGAHAVASGIVTLNGDTLIAPSTLNRAGHWSFDITPNAVATLTVRLAGAPGGMLDIWIDGVSTPPPVIAASISSTNFGFLLLGSTGPARTITVSNTGGSVTQVLSFTLSGLSPTNFIVNEGTCAGATLAPGASCDATVQFAPTGTSGARVATLTVSDGNVSVALPPFTGTTDSPPPAVLGATIDSPSFLTVFVGTPSIARVITVTNSGGSATGTIGFPFISNSNVNEYAVNAGTCAGVSLAPGASCTATVTLTPVTSGVKVATLSVTAGNLSVTLPTFTGLANFPPPPVLGATIDSPNFLNVVVGTPSIARVITVTNTGGSATSTIGFTFISNSNNNEYVVNPGTCAGATLAPGMSCTATVTLTAVTAGAKVATLAVTAGNLSVTLPTFTATANFLPPPVLGATIDSPNFLNVLVGTPSIGRVITVTNTGGSTTSTIGFTFISNSNNNEYAVDAGTCAGATLAPGASCTATVTLTPITAGAKLATLSVTAGNLSVVLPTLIGGAF
jgi:hypothetical protein